MAKKRRQSKLSPIPPEDVRVVPHRDGKGVEGMALGPKATAALREARAKAKRDKK